MRGGIEADLIAIYRPDDGCAIVWRLSPRAAYGAVLAAGSYGGAGRRRYWG